LNYYETRRSGEIVSRLRDINEINNLVARCSLPSQLFIAVISFSFMLFYSWKLTLAVILIAGLMTVSTLPLLPVLRQRPAIFGLGGRKSRRSGGNFKGAMVIKATNAAPVLGRVSESLWSPPPICRSVQSKSELLTAFLLNLLAASAVLLCLDWGAYW